MEYRKNGTADVHYYSDRLLRTGLPGAVSIGEACDALRSIECDYEIWLVIDNFQFLNTGLPSSFLAALLEHGGAGLHIIVVTQMLGRDIHTAIAGRGFLHITAADLRLEAGDVRRYYALAGTPDVKIMAAGQVFLKNRPKKLSIRTGRNSKFYFIMPNILIAIVNMTICRFSALLFLYTAVESGHHTQSFCFNFIWRGLYFRYLKFSDLGSIIGS